MTVGADAEEASCSLEESHGDKVVLIGFKSHAEVMAKAKQNLDRTLRLPVETRLITDEHPEEISNIFDEILASEAHRFDQVILTATAGEMSLTEKAVAEAIAKNIRVVL